jgi:hypothetical protein
MPPARVFGKYKALLMRRILGLDLEIQRGTLSSASPGAARVH